MAVKEQATRSLSNDAENNVRECKAIMVKSGPEVQATVESNGEVTALTKAKKETLAERVEKEPFRPGRIMFPDNPLNITTPLLYPQCFKKKTLDEQFSKFLEVFKKLHINIPFADALEHMPNYEKFLKKMMANKHKVEEFKMVSLTEEYSVIVQKNFQRRRKTPGALPSLARSATPHLPMCYVI